MVPPKPLLGVGAGGHARVVLEAVRLQGGYEALAFLDPRLELLGTSVLGVPITGDDSLLERYHADGVRDAFVGLGGAHDTRPRRRLCDLVVSSGFRLVTIVHPAAAVSESAELAGGATILAMAVVGAGARVGANAIVNSGAVVEHDCVLGDYVHVASGATLASEVVVGDGAHVGAGSVIRQGIRIGEGAIVGAGAAVIADVPDGVVVAGVPARILRDATH
jgi:UDP-perosamine 4-acetyltransferase